MKGLFLFYLLFLSISGYSQFGPELSFQETKGDSINRSVDNILILGIGSVHSRIFLDKLSDKIVAGFAKHNVTSRYLYLGKTVKEAKEEFRSMQIKNYHSILLFLPRDSAFFNIETIQQQYSTYDPVMGRTGPVYNSRTAIMYEQSFDVHFFVVKEDTTFIWAALMDISGEIDNRKLYSKISKKLLNSFKKHKYIK